MLLTRNRNKTRRGHQTPLNKQIPTQLYKAFNDANQKDTWTDLNFQQMFGQRMDSIQIHDNSTHKVGRDVLINRLSVLNGHIKYNDDGNINDGSR